MTPSTRDREKIKAQDRINKARAGRLQRIKSGKPTPAKKKPALEVGAIEHGKTYPLAMAVEICGCGLSTVRRAIERGELDAPRRGYRRYVSGAEFGRWLAGLPKPAGSN